MLLWLLDLLGADVASTSWCGNLAALEKITFRASLAAMAAFALALVLGPRLIGWLRVRFREPIKSDSPRVCQLHARKEATPTMGGLFLIAGLVAGSLVFGDLGNRYLQASLLLAVGLGALGALDDLTKLRGPWWRSPARDFPVRSDGGDGGHSRPTVDRNGISARTKLLGQLIVSSVAAALVYRQHAALDGGLALRVPLVEASFPLGLWFVPLAVIVIVGFSNAVNLTDGLDGLAGGCLVFAAGAMAVLAYVGGHAELADYLGVPRVPGAGEMTVLGGAMIGAVLGFLWFNCHPAQVFMGDTGSLPLGGLLGLLAVVSRQELLLLVAGGVFMAEAASVILQVGYYKWRRRRILLCAPLHHHFQFRGSPESRIVVRFWIASAVCAILAVATLKLGAGDSAPVPPGWVKTAENPHNWQTPLVPVTNETDLVKSTPGNHEDNIVGPPSRARVGRPTRGVFFSPEGSPAAARPPRGSPSTAGER
jgi:phospho-N-acetylmuramoyl-pentapeptide-transferase